MRKILLLLATLVVLAGLFIGSWYVTGNIGKEAAVTVVPPTGVAEGDSNPDDTGTATSETVTATSEPASLDLTKPEDIAGLNRLIDAVGQRLGGGSLYYARLALYTSITAFDTGQPAGLSTFIASSAGAQPSEQAALAGSNVIAGIVNNAEVSAAVSSWGELTPESQRIVDAVLAVAASDGFDATSGVAAPGFSGELAWVPGSTRDGLPAGIEPGFGGAKTFNLDLAKCPVPTAPQNAIAAERSKLGNLNLETPQPNSGNIERIAFPVLVYLLTELPGQDGGKKARYQTQVVLTMLYDTLVATWKAKWENGIAAPIDLLANGDTTKMTSFPSYPSWHSVAAAATETYVSGITGRDVAFEEILAAVKQTPNAQLGNSIASLENDLQGVSSGVFNWKADIEAGRDLGKCIGRETLSGAGR